MQCRMLDDLTKAIESLLAKYEQTKSENRTLKARLEEYAAMQEANKSKIEILEKKISDLQLSIAFAASSSKDMNEAKKRISKLIRDIDDCIGMLGE